MMIVITEIRSTKNMTMIKIRAIMMRMVKKIMMMMMMMIDRDGVRCQDSKQLNQKIGHNLRIEAIIAV